MEQIGTLKEENQELKSVLSENNISYKLQSEIEKRQEAESSTFVTQGAENPNITCENW